MSRDKVAVRWWLLVTTLFAGFFLVAWAIVLDAAGTRDDILPSVLLEIGTALGLAGVLFLLERVFTRVIRAEEEATGVADWIAAEEYEPSGVGDALLARMAMNHRRTALVLFHIGRVVFSVPAAYLIFRTLLRALDWVTLPLSGASEVVRAFLDGTHFFTHPDYAFQWPVRFFCR